MKYAELMKKCERLMSENADVLSDFYSYDVREILEFEEDRDAARAKHIARAQRDKVHEISYHEEYLNNFAASTFTGYCDSYGGNDYADGVLYCSMNAIQAAYDDYRMSCEW